LANRLEGDLGSNGRRERLLRVLETYGADPARWPETERDELQRLLSTADQALVEAVGRARELDAVLATVTAPAVEPGPSLERFLARLPEKLAPPSTGTDRRWYRPGARAVRPPFRLPWPALSALAASLAAGLLIGAGGLAHDFIPPLLAGEADEEELWPFPGLDDAAALLEDEP
jgi:hypothetical protein